MYTVKMVYHGDHTTGADGVTQSHTLEVRVLAPPHEELATDVVGTLVHHEAATVHPAGLTTAEVGGHISTVAHALMGATLEVSLLVEDDLQRNTKISQFIPLWDKILLC